MTKRGLSHPEHLRTGQILTGLRSQLLKQQVLLLNAYPRTGPRAVPAQQLEAAIDLIDEVRRELEKVVFEEHPGLAATEDYFPWEEHQATVVVPRKPGSAPVPLPFGE